MRPTAMSNVVSGYVQACLAPLRMARTVDRNVANGNAVAAIPDMASHPHVAPHHAVTWNTDARIAGAETTMPARSSPAGIVLLR